MVEARHVKLVPMPKDSVPSDAFETVESAQGRIATMTLLQGDVLRAARLAEHMGGSTLASLIEPNKRAVSVRVDDVVGVGGFLLPGNRVDVLVSRKLPGTTNRAESETILYDLRVLAVDQTASTDKTQPVVVRAVTLEMNSEEAEKLVKAQAEGRIQLALRNPVDDSRPAPKPEPEPVIVHVPVPAPAPEPPKKAYRPAAPQITIIRGTDVEKVQVSN